MTFVGKLVSRLIGKGSKFEHEGHVLVHDDGSESLITLVGDNPFEQNELKPYQGYRVLVHGNKTPNGTILGDSIVTI